MTIQTFYRCSVWLPLLVPALVAIAVNVLGARPRPGTLPEVVEVLLVSGIYGGLPYAVIAAWGTWWIDHRPEREIRRRALLAPLWMLAAWIVFAAVLGTLARTIWMVAGLVGLGAVIIFPLGYAYVAVVFLLRRLLHLTDSSRAGDEEELSSTLLDSPTGETERPSPPSGV